MDNSNLAVWLRYYDPIHRGGTRFGIANGLTATNGFFFPRIRGGYNLYRSTERVPDVTGELVGAAGAEASSLQPFPWVAHQARTTYQYRLVPVGGGGVENWSDETVVPLRLDSAGDWMGPLPNAPTDLQ